MANNQYTDHNPPELDHSTAVCPNSSNQDSDIMNILVEVRSLREANLRATKDQALVIISLLVIGIGILSYLCYYIVQFKPEDVDQFVSAGIEKLEADNQIYLPVEAKIKLSSSPRSHPIFWDNLSKNWMIQHSNGVRPLSNQTIIPIKAWDEIMDLGFSWNEGKWTIQSSK
ncbi:MAG: hypothetical protein P8N49_08820 [Opitutales bacterium]|nr:hypothetical protein [Opitutales bacterium]